jgi:alginate O-acetyltransferase complex protein AlgI
MVFSSYLFLFYFLPVALLLYHAAPRRLQHLTLTSLSYLFYGWANPLFVPLLLGSTTVDYFAGRVIARHPEVERGTDEGRSALRRARPARLALTASICSNLALLGFFKYFNFAAENMDALADAIGLPALRLDVAFRVTLPLGISFYTFQSMSYTIDVYRGRAPRSATSSTSPATCRCSRSWWPGRSSASRRWPTS